MSYQDVLNFWFEEIDSSKWFEKDPEFDAMLRKKFGDIHYQATQGECEEWRTTIQGRLAEVIVLDQFSRNLFRDDPRSFAYDGMALVLAQEAIKQSTLSELTVEERGFLYMPFMHSESLSIHQKAIELFSEPGLETKLDYEKKHQQIISVYGRYPHRNKILGRLSTQEERLFLKGPNSSF
ncbi:MAG: DUF924 family protein [Vagococcus sp.]